MALRELRLARFPPSHAERRILAGDLSSGPMVVAKAMAASWRSVEMVLANTADSCSICPTEHGELLAVVVVDVGGHPTAFDMPSLLAISGPMVMIRTAKIFFDA